MCFILEKKALVVDINWLIDNRQNNNAFDVAWRNREVQHGEKRLRGEDPDGADVHIYTCYLSDYGSYRLNKRRNASITASEGG